MITNRLKLVISEFLFVWWFWKKKLLCVICCVVMLMSLRMVFCFIWSKFCKL